MKKACYAEHFAGFFLSLCWLNYIMLPGDGQERPGIPGTASAVRSSGGQEAANVSDLHGCPGIGTMVKRATPKTGCTPWPGHEWGFMGTAATHTRKKC